MGMLICEDCGKRYDYDRDEFCPRCGAFNQPVKTWGVDQKGNVIRVDGVNEENHAGSFVHKEVHQEKRNRRAAGMDWDGKGGRPTPPRPQTRQASPMQTLGIIIAIIVFVNLIRLLLYALLT